jgi:hypothetical protein
MPTSAAESTRRLPPEKFARERAFRTLGMAFSYKGH